MRSFVAVLLWIVLSVACLAAPDLIGFDGRSFGGAHASWYYDVQESSVYWGETLHLKFAVWNQSADAAGAFRVKFYLSADSTIDPATDYAVGPEVNFSSGLAAWSYGGYSTYSLSITLPSINPVGGSGTFYIGMVCDISNTVAEANESNNRNQGSGKDLDSLTILTPVPDIQVTDSVDPAGDLSVNFGSVVDDGRSNAISTRSVTIANVGKASLSVLQNGVALSGGTHYRIESIYSSLQDFISLSSGAKTLASNGRETWLVTLVFDPTTTGTVNDVLSIASDDPDEALVQVNLTGVGLAVPDVAVDRPSVEFGACSADGPGLRGVERVVQLRNEGSGLLTISQNGVGLISGTNFSVVSITSSVAGAVNLAAGPATVAKKGGEIWSIRLRFDPRDTGVVSDGLRVSSDDPDEGTLIVSLSGVGQVVQDVTVLAPLGGALDFGGVHADGVGHQAVTGVVVLANAGDAVLNVASNGITVLPGGVFQIVSVVSSTSGVVNLAAGGMSLAGATQETWSVTVRFDPLQPGLASNRLYVVSDDPDESAFEVPLLGTGLKECDVVVEDGDLPANDLQCSFGPVLNDGLGNRTRLLNFTLSNIGTEPLVVAQNGIRLGAAGPYLVTQVISSVSGPVNLAAGSDTLSGTNSETWTVAVVFDPPSDGMSTNQLIVESNDPDEPQVRVALEGAGVRPVITVTAPSADLGVPAERAYTITWNDEYAAGDAAISLFLDADMDPATGLLPVASGLSEDSDNNALVRQLPSSLIGGAYYIYAEIADGIATQGDYSTGRLIIEEVNSLRLLSPPETANESYALRYLYHGVTYTSRVTLAMGENIIVVTSADGVRHEFPVTRVESLVDREGYAYDEMGRVAVVTNARGIVTRFTYDAMGRLTRTEPSEGSPTEFSYDPLGHVIRMGDGTGWTFYDYDELEHLTSVVHSVDATRGGSDDLTARYEYNLGGQRTAMTYPCGERVEYGYDPAGRLAAVTNVTRGVNVGYKYNPTNGVLVAIFWPNGIVSQYGYDDSARVTEVSHRRLADGTLIISYAYVFDAADRRTEFRTVWPSGTNVETYTYDDLNQLIGVVVSGDGIGRATTYSYDGNGNRRSKTVTIGGGPAETLHYVYGNENRLVAITNELGDTLARYSYDAAGNCVMKVTPADVTRYEYDERNLLTRVIGATNYIEYAYDGVGARMSKTVNGVRTRYVSDLSADVWQTLEERAADGSVRAVYTYGRDRVGEMTASGEWFPLCDALGSVRLLADGAGHVITNGGYDAYGTPDRVSDVGGEYLFLGERRDPETGLIHLRARQYDPEIGRFMTKDPLGYSAGINAYVYCGNDPVNRSDPMGLDDDATAFEAYINGKSLVYYGINTDHDEAVRQVEAAGFDMNNTVVVAPYWNDGGGLASTFEQCMIVGGRQIGLGSATPEGASLAGQHFDNVYYFSGGGAAFRTDAEAYGITYGQEHSFGSTVGPDGRTELFGTFTHGRDLMGTLTDVIVGSVPHGVDLGASYDDPGERTTGIGAAFTIKGDSIFEIGSKIFHGIFGGGSDAGSTASLDVGGVLIDKAATFMGSNLCDIVGATYDPVSHQVVFLGTNDVSAVKDINMDYFYTAVQAVYGSAVPPFVTLDPPATIVGPWTDLGDGDGVFESGELGGLVLRYNPLWVDGRDDLRLRFKMHWGDATTDFTTYINGYVWSNILAGGRYAMNLQITNWAGLPAGVNTQKFAYTQLHLSSKGQETYYNLILTNGSGGSFIMDSVNVVPDLQHRKYGGRVDGTRLGWVMYEADRVMKCLGVGVDNLTGARYDSMTLPVAGYSNLIERSLASTDEAGNMRFWFVPNEMTLNRHVDPETGRSTIVFDRASVALKTESFLRGLPQPVIARAFADHFNAHYDEFAARAWPVMDPDDPTGQTIIQVKIFERLREAMQAVSLARFFRDNDIPLDMWWLASWAPPRAYSPKVIPTAYNETTNGARWVVLYGGVEVNKPNAYVPSATAESVGQLVLAQRPDETGDLDEQAWTVSGTAQGSLVAVATSVDAQRQDASVRLVERDMDFESPGDFRLQMMRLYDSGCVGRGWMGPGWRALRYGLEFSRPSWYDENGLMRDASTNALWADDVGNTRLRSGEVRLVDYATGSYLDFASSLALGYDVDSLGRPVIATAGLAPGNVPTFTPGRRADGSVLSQKTDTARGYIVARPDGSVMTFDHEGWLIAITDRNAYALSYRYATNGLLTNVVDSAGQALRFTFDVSNRLAAVFGPASEEVRYTYDGRGRLTNALHVRSGATTTYAYNNDNQLVDVTRFDGVKRLASSPDLRGRSAGRVDGRGNEFAYAFDVDAETLARTSVMEDAASGDAWTREVDAAGRLVAAEDPLGHRVACGYAGDSPYVSEVQLPIGGRAAIHIDRNGQGLPVRVDDPENEGSVPVTVSYNAAGRPVCITNAMGRRSAFAWNGAQDLAEQTRYAGGQPVRTTFGYLGGYLHAVTNPLGYATRYDRDALGRITNVVDATGVGLGMTYDALGRVVRIHDPHYSAPLTLEYNEFDALTRVTMPSGSIGMGHDPVTHRCVAITNAQGAVQRMEYDPDTGDLLSVIEENRMGASRIMRYEYDRFGRVAKITAPEGEEAVFRYDALGRVAGRSEVDRRPPGAPEVLESDAAKNGRWTNAVNHVFTWAAPETDSGIEGYSWSINAAPDTNINVTAAAIARNGLTEGVHTFQVRAKSRAGLWGPPATFELRLDTTEPGSASADVSVEKSDAGDYVVGPVRATWSGFTDNLAGVDGYYFSFADHSRSAQGQHSEGAEGVLTNPVYGAVNTVYVWARDGAGNIGPAVSATARVLDPAADEDSDGMSNAAEEIAGTGADNPQAALWLDPEVRSDGDRVTIGWFGASNRVYDLLMATDFAGAWSEVPGWQDRVGANALITYTGTVSSTGPSFFRVGVRKP